MGTLGFTSHARDELLDVWAYIAAQNLPAADRVLDRLEKGCQPLREFPLFGRARPEIAADARSIAVGRWVVLHRLVEGGVQVARIVDGARDLARIDWPP